MASRMASIECNADTGNYALVVFEDEQCTAVVPKDRVINLVRDEDNKCDVKWANKKLYQGKVLLFGTKSECEKKQIEVEDEMESQSTTEDKENHKPIPKRQKQFHKQPGQGSTKKTSKAKVIAKKGSKKEKDTFDMHVGSAPQRDGPPPMIDNKDGQIQAISGDDGGLDRSEYELTSDSDNSDGNLKKIITIPLDDSRDKSRGNEVELANPMHNVDGQKIAGCQCELIHDQIADMGIKYDQLKKQVNGMQKIISSLFRLGAKVTAQKSSDNNISSCESTSSRESTHSSSQSSQTTSVMVQGPSSGEDTLSISSDDGLLSEEILAINASMAQTEGSVSTNSLSEPQGQTEPESNSTNLSVPQHEKKPESNSIDISVPQCLQVPPVGKSVEVSSLMTQTDLMQLYQQSCSRMNMAAKMSVRLFDEETRLTHNVSGRGKPKLNPKIIEFIRLQCFDFFPCKSSDNMEREWSECVKAIDEKSRRLKKQRKGSVATN